MMKATSTEILAAAQARQDDTLTVREWIALPLEIRQQVSRQCGYRSRRAVEGLTRSPTAPSARPANSPTAPAVSATPPNTASAAADASAQAIEYCLQRRRELGVPDSYTGKPETPEERWQRDASLREEFVEFEYFAAYERMEQAGRIRVAGKPLRPGVTATPAPNPNTLTLEEDTVRAWHADPSLRREFAELAEYAGLRRYVAGLTDPSEPRPRVSKERLDLERAREEDRSANVDPRLPVEERARLAWEASETIRWEFRGNQNAYVALRKHIEKRR